ncbi:hypothetical protein CEXT_199321 [Caerostris extrusa]|uniref:Uncharacterized protein n=1 Tax=Caerostris extrusa TaxID=172846 RepID=A0AAV4WT26_CAEEX|nr:hypothetical protein CEXT_199321 [Caerostris extrusa]
MGDRYDKAVNQNVFSRKLVTPHTTSLGCYFKIETGPTLDNDTVPLSRVERHFSKGRAGRVGHPLFPLCNDETTLPQGGRLRDMREERARGKNERDLRRENNSVFNLQSPVSICTEKEDVVSKVWEEKKQDSRYRIKARGFFGIWPDSRRFRGKRTATRGLKELSTTRSAGEILEPRFMGGRGACQTKASPPLFLLGACRKKGDFQNLVLETL